MFEEKSQKNKANRNKIDQLIGVAPESAPRKMSPSSDMINAGKMFQEKRPKSSMEWNDMTGSPKWVMGDLSSPLVGTASEASRSFLVENHALMGISEDLEDLTEVDSFEWGGMQHVRYQQKFQGFPIFGAEAVIGMDQNHKVAIVANDMVKDISLKTEKERISAKEAMRIAMEDLGEGAALRGRPDHDTILYPTGDGFAKVYHCLIPTEEPIGDWEYFIDIQSGEIVDSFNSMRFYFAGRAWIYPENPEDTALATVMLRNLKWPYRRLDGKFCKVFNDDAPEAVSGPNYRFDFPEDDTHFDEPQVYYAVERAYDYFRDLGFRGFTFNNPYGRGRSGQIGAVVHVGTSYNNAFYRPSTGLVYFGDGSYNGTKSGLRDLAREVDVVAHELTHAVIDEYRPGIAGTDGAALHEGYSDYFACSLTDEPELGEYVVPDPGMKGIIRTCHNKDRYTGNNPPYQPHTRGKVWAGACWDLREALGQHVADYLIFGSIFYLPRIPSFKNAKDALIRVDGWYCGGEFKSTIKKIFESDRGIPV